MEESFPIVQKVISSNGSYLKRFLVVVVVFVVAVPFLRFLVKSCVLQLLALDEVCELVLATFNHRPTLLELSSLAVLLFCWQLVFFFDVVVLF